MDPGPSVVSGAESRTGRRRWLKPALALVIFLLAFLRFIFVNLFRLHASLRKLGKLGMQFFFNPRTHRGLHGRVKNR